jgi:hypothetical protein
MNAFFARRRIVAVETACVADVAGFLLRDRLFMGHRKIDLFDDLFRIFEREPVAFCPADRQGVRK